MMMTIMMIIVITVCNNNRKGSSTLQVIRCGSTILGEIKRNNIALKYMQPLLLLTPPSNVFFFSVSN